MVCVLGARRRNGKGLYTFCSDAHGSESLMVGFILFLEYKTFLSNCYIFQSNCIYSLCCEPTWLCPLSMKNSKVYIEIRWLNLKSHPMVLLFQAMLFWEELVRLWGGSVLFLRTMSLCLCQGYNWPQFHFWTSSTGF